MHPGAPPKPLGSSPWPQEPALGRPKAITTLTLVSTCGQQDPTLLARYYRRGLVHPSAWWLQYWMSLIYVLLVWNLVVIPMRLVFVSEDGESPRYRPDGAAPTPCTGGCAAWDALEYLVDAVFILDIALAFRLGFYSRSIVDGQGGHFQSRGEPQGEAVMGPGRIARHYLRVWFWLDLASVVPWTALLSQGGEELRAITLLRNLKLVRLLRLFRYLRIRSFFKAWEAQGQALSKNPALVRLLQQALWVLILVHLVACFAYAVAWADNFGPGSWVAKVEEATGMGRKWSDHYLAALYWSAYTITTVGYGDISMLGTPLERAYGTLMTLVGAVVFAFVVSNVAELVHQMQSSSLENRARMDSINAYMRYRGLPATLQTRIRKYYSFSLSRQSMFDEAAILSTLPTHLRREVSLYLHRDMISQVPFFREAPTSFVAALVQALCPVFGAPGDFVITVGEAVNEMFFVDMGVVEVWNAEMSHVYRRATKGDFFGEVRCVPPLASPKARRNVRCLPPHSSARPHPRAPSATYLPSSPARSRCSRASRPPATAAPSRTSSCGRWRARSSRSCWSRTR